jgi:hypothetical protein
MKPRREEEGFVRGMQVERLDHLGMVAGICQEIGLAAYLEPRRICDTVTSTSSTARVLGNLSTLLAAPGSLFSPDTQGFQRLIAPGDQRLTAMNAIAHGQ